MEMLMDILEKLYSMTAFAAIGVFAYMLLRPNKYLHKTASRAE